MFALNLKNKQIFRRFRVPTTLSLLYDLAWFDDFVSLVWTIPQKFAIYTKIWLCLRRTKYLQRCTLSTMNKVIAKCDLFWSVYHNFKSKNTRFTHQLLMISSKYCGNPHWQLFHFSVYVNWDRWSVLKIFEMCLCIWRSEVDIWEVQVVLSRVIYRFVRFYPRDIFTTFPPLKSELKCKLIETHFVDRQ